MNTQKPTLFQKLEISVASPKQIREWAERFLPNGETVGEVTSWETVNYKTLKPESNGLFCQKIFGPVVDFTCACGKKTTKADRKTEFFVRGFCPKCGVERTHSRVRRYRLGYIKLKQPVVHPLYASQRPSPLGLCLNWPIKRVQAVMRTSEFCCLPQIFTIFQTQMESMAFFQNASQSFLHEKGFIDGPFSTQKHKTIKVKKGINFNRSSDFPTEKRLLFSICGTNRDQNEGISKPSYYLDSPRFYFGDKNKRFCSSFFKNDVFLKKLGVDNLGVQKERSFSFENGKGVLSREMLDRSKKMEERGYYLSKFQRELFQKRGEIWLTSRLLDIQTNERRKKKPHLFANTELKVSNRPFFVFNAGSGETRLYGISYDATWRQVEEFQEFLFYLWEQSFCYESSIPYYTFTKFVETQSREIPRHEQSYAIQTGGFALQHILSNLDLRGLQSELRACSVQGQGALVQLKERILGLDFKIVEHRKEIKRLRIKINRLQQLLLKWKRQLETFRDFEQGNMIPAWMILSYLPVLPPGLRPITSIRGELVVSDINSLYRKVLIRNKRINRGASFGVFDTALSGSWLSWCYNIRQIQEAVDELLKTGSIESGRPLKSLLEGLKGKQGRFRQHLLGKRVDYSGRSVIVVGPGLKIHQCGLPKQMAIELFQPFLIQKLRKKGIVFTTTAAKALIAERKAIVWSLLGEILKTHPVLLNRAPTLHRLGIQAFLPQLSEGKAVLLHPLVCPAFNADFDGDQMAVHVPLSAKTRAEALELLWSRNHILAPASGQPLLLPTQDMVLGFYYLTCSLENSVKSFESIVPSWKALARNQVLPNRTHNVYFSDFSQVKAAFDKGTLSLHTPIWVKWSGSVQTFLLEHQCRVKQNLLEVRLHLNGHRETLFLESCQFFTAETTWVQKSKFVRTTPGRVFMHSWIFQGT